MKKSMRYKYKQLLGVTCCYIRYNRGRKLYYVGKTLDLRGRYSNDELGTLIAILPCEPDELDKNELMMIAFCQAIGLPLSNVRIHRDIVYTPKQKKQPVYRASKNKYGNIF